MRGRAFGGWRVVSCEIDGGRADKEVAASGAGWYLVLYFSRTHLGG